MMLEERHAAAQKFFTRENAASYDFIAHYATFGRDRAWKNRIMDAVRGCESILDLASGTGILSSMLAMPGRTVTGLDMNLHYLLESKKRIQIRSVQATAEFLPYRAEQFDAVVSSYLAKYVNISTVARECMRVLNPGGIVVFHDFTTPSNPIMRKLWLSYFWILRLCSSFAPSWRVVFEELDGIIEKSRWVARTAEALDGAGFMRIACGYHTVGTAAIITAEKP